MKSWNLFSKAAGLTLIGAAIGAFGLWLILREPAVVTTNKEVTTIGKILSFENESIADNPAFMTVGLEDGSTVKVNHYCGFTSVADAVRIETEDELSIGDRVEIFGVKENDQFINVCDQRYRIKELANGGAAIAATGL